MSLTTIIKSIQSNKIKTLLIYLSLVVSICSIFLITAISNGVISMYSSMLQNDGDIIVTQAKISDTFFSNVDTKLMPKIEAIEGVTKVSALIVGASPVEELPIIAVYGVSSNMFSHYKLLLGSYPKQDEVMVGEGVYKQLHNKKEVHIANKTFRLSGVYKSDIGFENGGVIMQLHDAGELFNKSASMLHVNIDITDNIDTIIEHIKALSSDIDATSTQSFVANYNQFKIINKSSFVISLIAFIMGLIAIGSIMSITIIQRRDEFGIMKALGLSWSKITLLIAGEGVIIALGAFITALGVSELVLYIIKHIETLQGYVNGEIDIKLIIYVCLTTLLMTLLGSLIPIYTALKVDPVTLIQRGN